MLDPCFCGVALGVLPIFAIILPRKRECWLLYFNCIMALCSLSLSKGIMGCLQSLILTFPDHRHLLFVVIANMCIHYGNISV